MTEQTRAERLAEYLTGLAGEIDHTHYTDDVRLSAAELYRLSTVNAELLEALKLLVSYTMACERLLNASPAGQINIARAAIARATEE
jgi:hypothetical protein